MEFLRRREKPKENVLHVEERQIFLPFKDKVAFIPADLDEAYVSGDNPIILEQKIEFKGTYGRVLVFANPDPDEETPVTPLGNANLVTSYLDGKIKLTEAPCYLELQFEIKNQQQFDLLEEYQAQFYLNDEVYYLDCDGETHPEFAFHRFRNKEHVFAADFDLKDKNDVKVQVLLPQHIGLLSTIRMRICEYDDDDEDLDEELSPTPYVPDTVPSSF